MCARSCCCVLWKRSRSFSFSPSLTLVYGAVHSFSQPHFDKPNAYLEVILECVYTLRFHLCLSPFHSRKKVIVGHVYM